MNILVYRCKAQLEKYFCKYFSLVKILSPTIITYVFGTIHNASRPFLENKLVTANPINYISVAL
jgi:hypothetical protein